MAQTFGPVQGITWYMTSPGQVLAFDFDGDGDLDVLAGGDKLSWFENDGSGVFIAEHLVASLSSGTDMQLADMDGDADQDIVLLVTDVGQRQTRWLENLGGGVFNPPNDVTSVSEYNDSFVVDDLDSDGDMDIISTTSPNGLADDALVWYANDGNGIFAAGVPIDATSQDIQDIIAVDLDEDNDLDIVVTKQSFYMLWYENQGNATFSAEQVVDPDWAETRSVRAGDIDLDGDLDLVASYYFDGDLKWWENDGAENFSVHSISTFFLEPRDIELADLDEDGDLDIVGVGWGYPRWLENLGDGTFAAAVAVESGTSTVGSVEVTDLNGDGHPDVLWGGLDSRVAWSAGFGDGTFERSVTISPHLHTITAFACGDMDGDHDIDIVAGSVLHDKVSLVENIGGGAFLNPRNISTEDDFVQDVHLVDLDADGNVDVITASELNDRVAWYRNAGNGAFDPQRGISSSGAMATSVNSLDADEDGDVDVVSVANAIDQTRWYRHADQSFSFSTNTLTPAMNGARVVEVADLNGDQLQDVLVSGYYETELIWYPNTTTGTLGLAQTLPGDHEGDGQVLAADLDGDGDVDVVSSSGYSGDILLWRNTGGGVFGAPEVLLDTMYHVTMSMDAGDVDGDGDEDLAFFWYNPGSSVGWFENMGAGGPTLAQQGPANTVFDDIQLADLDGDGALDLVGGNITRTRLAWMRNELHAGCTDAAAVNYDPTALHDNGTCCYTAVGCTVAGASNYEPGNGCEDGSCVFPVTGSVFLDANSDGVQDVGETGLGGQEVRIFPSNTLVYTDSDGHFYASVSGSLGYSFLLTDPGADWNNTTPAFLEFNATVADWNQPMVFGLLASGQAFELAADIVSEASTYPCNGEVLHHVIITNQGNLPVDLDVSFTYDVDFVGHTAVSPIDSEVQNVLHYSAQNIEPGAIATFDVLLQTPDASFTGDLFDLLATVTALSGGNTVANTARTIAVPLSCTVDATQKQAVPEGWTAAHYIAATTSMGYVVRFENTSPNTVTDVLVIDTIDAGYDLGSFQLTGTSHSVSTSVNAASRTVHFHFANIQLPGSNDPDNASGFVSFTVDPGLGIAPQTTLTNTAYIYFDGALDQTTNTTFNTIIDCALMTAVPSVTELTVCRGAPFTVDIVGQLVENYAWSLDGIPVPGSTSVTTAVQQAGSSTLTLEYSGPFCSAELDIPITVLPAPTASIEGPDGLCAGATATVSTPSALPPTWYLNGTFFSSSDTIVIDDPGTYTLILTGVDCDSPPDTLIVTEHQLPLIPVIVPDGTLLTTDELVGATYQWFLNGDTLPGATGAEWQTLANGEYTVTITDANGCSNTSDVFLLLNVGLAQEQGAGITIHPVPADELLFIGVDDAGGAYRIDVADGQGRIVRSETRSARTGRMDLVVGDLVPGHYVLRLTGPKGSSVHPFVVEHAHH